MSQDRTGLNGKLKIAAWWLITVGVLAILLGIILIPVNLSAGYGEDSPISAPVAAAIFVMALVLPGVLNIVSGILLIKRRRQARALPLTLLSIECILSAAAAVAVSITEGLAIAAILFIALALYLIPLVMLLLDRSKTN